MNELSYEYDIRLSDLESMDYGQYFLIDLRDAESVEHGTIPHARNIPDAELLSRTAELPADKKIILFCPRGIISRESAQSLREAGFDAYSLEGGYNGWLLSEIGKEVQKEKALKESSEESADTKARQVERGINKKFHRQLFAPFIRAIIDYELVKENDRIAVCISGGKDSMLMAKLFQELKRRNKFPFELTFLVMDPGYSAENRKVLETNAELLDIPVTIFESPIFQSVFHIEKSPCYICARMRRGYLYRKASELGCNKIALGHHYDDVIETILMGMLYAGQIQTMMPKLHSSNFPGMELIRPMYLIREEDIKHWRDYYNLHFLQCECRFTETCTSCDSDGHSSSKRMEVKKLISRLHETNPYVEANIFKSVENINLSTIISYKKNGEKIRFTDTYDQEA